MLIIILAIFIISLYLLFVYSAIKNAKQKEWPETVGYVLLIIVLTFVLFSITKTAIDTSNYFNNKYACKEIITVEPHQEYTIENNTDKIYILQEGNLIAKLLFLDGESFSGTVKTNDTYTYQNNSIFKKKIKIYKSIK